jgi:F-type H+-transporting ATPase subunit a
LKTLKCFGILLLLTVFTFANPLLGQEENPSGKKDAEGKENKEQEFNSSEFIIEHVSDSHEWHILTKKNGEPVALYLPVILYSKDKGLTVFSSRNIAEGKTYKGYKLINEGDNKGKIGTVNAEGVINEKDLPWDFSITKAIVGMLGAVIIGLVLFISMARSYRKTGISAPKGVQSFMEPIILFVRDDIVVANLGAHKAERYIPYLLTVFFFIFINNLMGLVPFPPPFGASVTGNVNVTFVLALFTFLIVQFSGNKAYWKHIFATPGVPFWLLPIMIVVEIIGLFSKPFALMIRLFANITAGHIIVLSLVCLIFIFKSLAVAPVSIAFVIFMDCLELLVALLQAYIFTLLTSLFIGMAMPEEHHQ